MEVRELYHLVEDYYGYRCHMLHYNSETKEVACILYDSFIFKCNINDRYGRFGGGIQAGSKEFITIFLGKELSLNKDEKSIKESLQIVDDYCRLRLPDKFLKAYDEAYNSFL